MQKPFPSCAEEFSVRKSGSQTVHRNTGIFERLASITHWSKLCMTVKPPVLYILPSSISFSILSLYFAGVNSLFSFMTMNSLYEKISLGTLQTHRTWGYCSVGHDNTRPVEYTAASHRALLFCVVISSSGLFQCAGEKSLFSKRLKS